MSRQVNETNLFRMSKLYSKVSPLPVANDSWPNHQHEGVTFKEKLVEQEEKKEVPAISTLQNKQPNCINSTDLYISASIIIEIQNYQQQQGFRNVLKSLLGKRNIVLSRQCWKSSYSNPSSTFGASPLSSGDISYPFKL